MLGLGLLKAIFTLEIHHGLTVQVCATVLVHVSFGQIYYKLFISLMFFRH